MKTPSKLVEVVLGSAIAVFAAGVTADTHSPSNRWEHNVLLYGWVPDIDGTLNFDIPGGGSSAGVSASDLIDSLDGVFMGAYEGRKGKWSVKLDLLYLDLENSSQQTVSIGGPGFQASSNQGMTGTQIGLYGGYTAARTDDYVFDVIAGVRYFEIDADVQLQFTGPLPPQGPNLNLSQSVELWDAVVGVKGAYVVNEDWYLPYHLDVGAGDSDLTWQAVAGVGYRFDWGSVLAAYRHLYYDQGSSGFIQDLEFSGPAIGLSFSF